MVAPLKSGRPIVLVALLKDGHAEAFTGWNRSLSCLSSAHVWILDSGEAFFVCGLNVLYWHFNETHCRVAVTA